MDSRPKQFSRSLLLARSRVGMSSYDVKEGLGVTFQSLSVALGLPFLWRHPAATVTQQHKLQVPGETME